LREFIIPRLRDGWIVISDRYFLSSLAFGAADGVNLDYLIELNENKLNPELVEPDLTIFLKVHPEIAMLRIKARGKETERFERLKKLRTVLSHYQELIANRYEDIYIVDGEGGIKDISEKIRYTFETMIRAGWIRTLKQK